MAHSTPRPRIPKPLLHAERIEGGDRSTGHVAQRDLDEVPITLRLRFELDRLRPAPRDTPCDFRIAGQA
jgi:hypothetical protein